MKANSIVVSLIFFSKIVFAEVSVKEIEYAAQGNLALQNNDVVLACENYEIASNFAKGNSSKNYAKLSELRNKTCGYVEKQRRLVQEKNEAESRRNGLDLVKKNNKLCKGWPSIYQTTLEELAQNLGVNPTSITLNRVEKVNEVICYAHLYHSKGVSRCQIEFDDHGYIKKCIS